eukprot:c27415_g1_i1 orf=3-182(-)
MTARHLYKIRDISPFLVTSIDPENLDFGTPFFLAPLPIQHHELMQGRHHITSWVQLGAGN